MKAEAENTMNDEPTTVTLPFAAYQRLRAQAEPCPAGDAEKLRIAALHLDVLVGSLPITPNQRLALKRAVADVVVNS